MSEGDDVQPIRQSKRKRFKSWIKRVSRRLLSPFGSGRSEDVSASTDTGDARVGEDDTDQEASLSDATIPNDSIAGEEVDAPLTNEISSNNRTITAAGDVDLSGTWKPIVSSQFQSEYDAYLVKCGQSFLFRKAVVNGIQFQKEKIRQLNGGESLEIVATNPIGDWNRTLVASLASKPVYSEIVDPDKDLVKVESFWAENGTRHKSILRGKPNVNGGVFETVRYLESVDVLVCDSSFLPSPEDTKREYGNVIWRFSRVK
ncbi:hypothetical protein ACHAXT_006681 [Thalassiosira profunda]